MHPTQTWDLLLLVKNDFGKFSQNVKGKASDAGALDLVFSIDRPK
jgi:hypothetical protein